MKHLFFVSLFLFASVYSTFGQTTSREDIRKQLEAKRAEIEALEKQYTSVSSEDRLAYADFLREANTGLVRLLPREVHDPKLQKGLTSLTIRGGGSYYSFSRLTHEYGYGSDICLEADYLSVGFAGADYGMLLNLGDMPLEQISTDYPAAHYLATYNPPSLEAEIRREQRRFMEGNRIESTIYKTRIPLEVGSTFLLRSITFDRADVLVGFRVVRQDSDGSVILLWKLLKKYPTPLIARNG